MFRDGRLCRVRLRWSRCRWLATRGHAFDRYHADRFADQLLERLGMARGRPQLQFGIAGGVQREQRVLAAVFERE